MRVLQDAVSGTSKQHVAFDYARRIASGIHAASSVFSDSLTSLLKLPPGSKQWSICLRLNETVCPLTQSPAYDQVTVALWNQLGQAREELVTLPVHSATATVADASGKAIASQVVPSGETVSNYQRDTQEAAFVLSFLATLPPASVTTFTISQGHTTKLTSPSAAAPSASIVLPAASALRPALGAAIALENDFLSLNFSAATGRLASMSNKQSGTSITVSQDFCYYVGNIGDKSSGQKSGAYIFRPIDQPSDRGVCHPIGQPKISATLVQGGVVSEVRQVFGGWLTQVVRLAKGARHAEFEWTVGAVPLDNPAANHTLEQCVSWRQTAGCSADGKRQPSRDLNCTTPVSPAFSGYCECFDGRRAQKSGCGHIPFTCAQACQFDEGKEVVTRFSTSIASNATLFTDSNGREMQRRVRDYRPTWNLTQTEKVAGNYYPVNAAAAIRDDAAQLTLLVDRSQGAGSIRDGEVSGLR